MRLKRSMNSNGTSEQETAHRMLEESVVPVGPSLKKDVYNLKELNDHVHCQLLDKLSADQLGEHIAEGVSLLTDNRDCDNEVEQSRTCKCGQIYESYWQLEDEVNEAKYSQLHCSKCITDSPVRNVKGVNIENSNFDDSVELTRDVNNVSLNSLLETIPLAYNPQTKQLHMLNVENGNKHSDESDLNNSNINQESSKTSESANLVEKNSISSEILECVDKTLCHSSLSQTNGSSFSSISSLSTNTDISASALSGNDLDTCTPNEKESEDRPQGTCEDYSFLHDTGAKSKKRGISKFLSRNLFSWKSKETENVDSVNSQMESSTYIVSPPSSTWKLFSKSNPVMSMRDPVDNSCALPTPKPSSYNLDADCLASSTTALILENRPSNLPKKSAEEAMKHKQEYETMVEAARKKELKEAKQRKKMQQQQLKQEELLSNASRMWNKEILPNWENLKSTKKVRELWWQGIPPNVRGKIWKLAIGNDLNITEELYEICVNRARDRIRLAVESASICSEDVDNSDSSHNKEGSVEFIKLDVSRTFPHLCIFQKGGPYYDSLHSLLGAYVCYRPDVGYVQGMSFLAAVLILNVDVADAFICFSNLLNKPCQMAFFRLDEPVMKAYFLTYEEFFKENMAKLFGHFAKQNLTPDLYLMDWIYTLFSKSLPLDVASRLWDVFFRDGEEFLFRTALGILNLYKDTLLEMEFIHLAQFLTKLPDNISAEPLFKAIDSIQMTTDKKKFHQILALHLTDLNKE